MLKGATYVADLRFSAARHSTHHDLPDRWSTQQSAAVAQTDASFSAAETAAAVAMETAETLLSYTHTHT